MTQHLAIVQGSRVCFPNTPSQCWWFKYLTPGSPFSTHPSLLLEPQLVSPVGSPSFELDHDHFFDAGQGIYGCFNAGGLLCPIIHDGFADRCRP
jgi:hypothetical protein